MKNNWPVKKLGEILSFEYGKSLPEKNRVNGNVSVFGSNGMIGFNNKKLVDGPGVIIGRKGSIGEIVWSDSDFWPIDTTYYAKLNSNENLKFIYYLLSTLNLKRLNKASGVPGLNRNDVYLLSVSLPAISCQEKIVEKLDTIRKAQELCDQQIQKTAELFESILEKELNNKSVKNEIKKLSEICDVRDGTHDSPKYQTFGIPLITSKNLKDEIDFSNVNYISEKDHEQIIKRSFVENGDILFGMIGTIGNPVIVNTNIKFSIKNVGLIKFPNKLVNNLFIKYFLQSNRLKKTIVRLSRGGTQKFVSLGNLRNLLIPFPDMKEQRRIVQKLEAVQDYKKLLQKQKLLFKELFDSVLNKSMKGKLDS